MGPEKPNVTVLETYLEHGAVMYDLSHGPQFSPPCLALVKPFKTSVGLLLLNTFSAYVEKLERVCL